MAIVGGHAVTVSYDVLKAVASHPITVNSLAQFKVDWEQVYGQGKVIYDLELEVRG